jgi:hypothetical protein
MKNYYLYLSFLFQIGISDRGLGVIIDSIAFIIWELYCALPVRFIHHVRLIKLNP